MKNLIAAGILALASTLSVASAPDPANINPLTALTTSTTNPLLTPVGVGLGYSFHVNQPLLVNAIGTFDPSRFHEIFLWDSKGNVLFSDVMPRSYDYGGIVTSAAGYQFIDFNTVLPVGDYVIAGGNFGGRQNEWGEFGSYNPTFWGGTVNPLITVTGSDISTVALKPGDFTDPRKIFFSTYVTLSAVALTSAVPEPSTYAMLFVGLAMMGVVARRRKR